MAIKVIPRAINTLLTKGENNIEQKLKRALIREGIEGDAFIYPQKPINGMRPDLVLIRSDFGVIIIEVKDWSDFYIKDITKRSVYLNDSEKEIQLHPTRQLIRYRDLIEGNLCLINDFMDDEGNTNVDIRLIIMFPYLSKVELDKYRESLSHDHHYIEMYAKEDLKNDLDMVDFNTGKHNFSEHELNCLRGAIYQENILPSVYLKDCKALRSINDIKTLDEKQEVWAKNIPHGHYRVTGLPGSGKTVMLLARALHLLKEDTTKTVRILITTFNKGLADKLRDQIKERLYELKLEEFSDNIEVTHFHAFCSKFVGKADISGLDSKKINQYWAETYPLKAFNCLNRKHNRGETDHLYDHVLIDEYQDFHALWLRMMKLVCRLSKGDKDGEESECLFIAGDRIQQLYDVEPVNFLKEGIHIRGRSLLLKSAYRTKKGHLDLGLRLLSKDPVIKKEVADFYEIDCENNKIEYDPCNVKTAIINDYHRFISRMGKWVSNDKIDPKRVLILFHYNGEISKFHTEIKKVYKDDSRIRNKLLECIALTYRGSKGREAEFCCLTGVDKFDAHLKDSIRSQERKNAQFARRLLYVGMTRASRQVIFCANENIGLMAEISSIIDEAIKDKQSMTVTQYAI